MTVSPARDRLRLAVDRPVEGAHRAPIEREVGEIVLGAGEHGLDPRHRRGDRRRRPAAMRVGEAPLQPPHRRAAARLGQLGADDAARAPDDRAQADARVSNKAYHGIRDLADRRARVPLFALHTGFAPP